MKSTASFIIVLTAGLLCASAWADDAKFASVSNRQEVSARFERLQGELMNNLANHLITPDQYSAELSKLNQLKVQERADASQNNHGLTADQQSMYNDLLSQIQRDIDQMLENAPPQPATPTVVSTPVVLPDTTRRNGRTDVYEELQRLKTELTNNLTTHMITSDQYHAEMTKLDQLKIQAHADSSQDNLKQDQGMYRDALNQIQRDIDQMLEANTAPQQP